MVGFVGFAIRLVVFHRLYNKSLKNNKQQTEGGKKKQTNTDLELQMQKGKIGTLAFYVCSWLLQELCESPTQLPKMLTHLYFGVSLPTDCPGVSLLTE